MTTDADKQDLFRRARAAVKLDLYARVLASMFHYGQDRAQEITPRFGLSLEQWRVVDEAWTDELAEGARRQQSEQGLRFSAGFAKERLRLHREQPPIASIGVESAAASAAPVPVAASWQPPAAPAPVAGAYAPGPSAAVSPWSEHRGPAAPGPRSPAPGLGATADISAYVPRGPFPFDPKKPDDDPSKPR